MVKQENPNPIGYKSVIGAIKPVMFEKKVLKFPLQEGHDKTI